jgi:hypothetical protein
MNGRRGKEKANGRQQGRSADVEDDHATIRVVFFVPGARSLRSRVAFERQLEARLVVVTPGPLPLLTLSYLLDDERR